MRATVSRDISVGIAGGCALVAVWIFTFVVMAVLMILGPGLLLGFLLAAGCEDQRGPLLPSPDSESGYVAQVRSRDCGAVGWNTRVVISQQYTFALDEHPQQIELAFGSMRPHDVELEWTGETTLLITNKWSPRKVSDTTLVEWYGLEIQVGISSFRK